MSEPTRSADRQAGSRGFTLIELLVVLLLIGIILSFATLSTGRDPLAERLEREARRLTAVLELAREEAILRSQELGLSFTRQGYRFLTLEQVEGEQVWRVLDDGGGVLRPRVLPRGVEVELAIEGRPVVVAASNDAKAEPQIMILSSGDLTPFELTLRPTEDRDREPYTLDARMDGTIRLEGPGVQAPPQADDTRTGSNGSDIPSLATWSLSALLT